MTKFSSLRGVLCLHEHFLVSRYGAGRAIDMVPWSVMY